MAGCLSTDPPYMNQKNTKNHTNKAHQQTWKITQTTQWGDA